MAWVDQIIGGVSQMVGKQLAVSSNWGSLHPDLIGNIAPCGVDGMESPIGGVAAPFQELNFEQEFNWQSAFENMSSDSKHPTIAAAIQSASMVQSIQVLKQVAANGEGGLEEQQGLLAKGTQYLEDLFQKGQGRTGITKLNSRQVFTGNAPLKLSGTLVFRAYQDPISEVVGPINQLIAMAYPKSLADGFIQGAVQSKDVVSLLFPSEAPGYVALTYKGVTYKPLVIENISRPLVNPYSPMGDVFATVQIALGSHQSWDTKDYMAAQQGMFGGLVNDAVNAASSLFK